MKVIMDNLVYSASATNEDENYPAENLYDEHPQKVFKAEENKQSSIQSTVTLHSYGDCNSICFVNTNATLIDVSLTDGVTVWSGTYDLSGIDTVVSLMHDQKVRYKDLWVDYPHYSRPVVITINFYLVNTSDTILYCGVVVNGMSYALPNPTYGINESLIDTSVIKWTSNQSLYYRKRDVVRKYSGSVFVDRDKQLFFFMRYIAMRKGPAPMVWNIISENKQMWVVYGTMAGNMPSASHDGFSHSIMSFSIQEVI